MKKATKAFNYLLCTAVLFSVLGTEIGAVRSQKIYNIKSTEGAENTVYMGGYPTGIRFSSESITVVGFSEVDAEGDNRNPAYSAGIRENDIIIHINSKEIKSIEDVIGETEASGGNPITIDVKRDKEYLSFSLTPALSKSDGKYKTGMWVKDTSAGIGTVTFVIPETGGFAALGHGICSSEGELIKLSKSYVTDIDITDVKKGVDGTPGELHGTLGADKTGTVIKNTASGIYGVYGTLPAFLTKDDAVEVAKNEEITTGDATVRCTLADNAEGEYKINIVSIDNENADNRNFVIEVKDDSLISQTGGIVQGMSGSPIIQNGKLIGAVTHVFVGDPTKGYGISVQKMLDGMPDILK